VRWEDGKRVDLPADFFSSTHYVDKLVQSIDIGHSAGKPLMATLSLQAVHSPLHAPQADIDKYRNFQAGRAAVAARRTDAFAYVADFLPTLLDVAGIPLPDDDYKGLALLRPTGKSLLPLMQGKAQRVRGPEEPTGSEGGGGAAISTGVITS